MAQNNSERVAILYPGDRETRRNATPANNRFADLFRAFSANGILAKPAVAVAAGKGLFYRQLEMGIEAAYQLAGQTMACNMMAPDTLEGVQAFIDKRPPSWGTPRG